ncbi:MAG: alpha/beta hydrolase-fold protein [Cyclobacteriaceae bacterium]
MELLRIFAGMEKYRPIIRVIEEDYEIPQLGKHRRISALLPYDYDKSDTQYPVLYMQDGQNLFNPNAPFGDWGIDRSLAELAEKGLKDIIIIAIDHGEKERIKEYLPFKNSKLGPGDGERYLEFMLKTLKPYVDRTFRVKADRANTGIGGSSMGGLISLYAGLTRTSYFGKIMVFSPSLWISPMINEYGLHFSPTEKTDLYLYAGRKESKYHIPNVERFKSALLKHKKSHPNLHIRLSINDDGEHNEYFWGMEFPKALKWLYFNK